MKRLSPRLPALRLAACLALSACAGAPVSSGIAPSSAAPSQAAVSADSPAQTPLPEAFTICVDNDSLDAYRQLLTVELPARYPEVEITVTNLMDTFGPDGAPLGAAELMARVEEMRTQVMSGQGPDLFILSAAGSNLFADPPKTMAAGAFEDLAADLDDITGGAPVNEAVLAAGALDGAQYLLPLTYTVPAVVADASVLAGFETGAQDSPARFLEGLMDHTGAQNAWPLTWLAYRGDQMAARSVLEQAEAGALDEDTLALLALVAQSRQPAFAGTSVDLFPHENVPFAADAAGATLIPLWAQALAEAGGQPQVMAVPNGQGGTTASVQLYAAVRAGSPGRALAVEILPLLLDAQWMGTSGITRAGLCLSETATEALLAEAFAQTPDLAGQYARAADAVNAARFTALADGALRSSVLDAIAQGQSPAQAADAFVQAYQVYLSE